MDVIPTDLIALNAYSARHGERNGTSANRRCAHACGAPGSDGGASEATGTRRRTDLVQATLGAEDGDVAVIPRPAAARHLGRSSRSRARDECRPVRPARFKKVTPRLANDRRRSERRAIARTDRASERDSLDRSSGKFIGCFTFNRPRKKYAVALKMFAPARRGVPQKTHPERSTTLQCTTSATCADQLATGPMASGPGPSGLVETDCARIPSHASIARRQCLSSLILSVSKSSPKKFASLPYAKFRGSNRQPGNTLPAVTSSKGFSSRPVR